jgi:ribosomal RNA-processing protein 36
MIGRNVLCHSQPQQYSVDDPSTTPQKNINRRSQRLNINFGNQLNLMKLVWSDLSIHGIRTMANSKKRAAPVERDDSASEPYSDELEVSSPEVLDFGEKGEVLFNSDWQEDGESGEGSDEDDLDEGEEELGNGADAEDGNADELSSGEEVDGDEEVEEDEDEDMEEDDGEDEDEKIFRKLSTVSFGALVKAQDSLQHGTKKRKRETTGDQTEEKLDELRKRLKELQNKSEKSRPGMEAGNLKSQQSRRNSHTDISKQRESDEERRSSQYRSSKHTPTSQSSKHAVSRKRPVIDVRKNVARDPRFDAPAVPADREKIRKNYKFLDDYVDSEIKELKSALKGQKLPGNDQVTQQKRNKKNKKGAKLSPEEIIALKKELTQKESKRATQMARDRELEVQKEHKKQERDLVKQGKKPFFLKRSDVKKQVLVKRFEGMSEGKREKVMEKKRRKMAAKERRHMPAVRRV